MKIDEMLAREAIRYTVSLYNFAVDEGRYEDLEKVFAPDAVMQIQDGPLIEGADKIIALLSGGSAKRGHPPGTFQRHNMAAPWIEMTSPGRAKGKHNIIVMTELGLDHCGRYEDDYVQSGERWLIARRSARMEWARDDSRFVKWLGKPGV